MTPADGQTLRLLNQETIDFLSGADRDESGGAVLCLLEDPDDVSSAEELSVH